MFYFTCAYVYEFVCVQAYVQIYILACVYASKRIFVSDFPLWGFTCGFMCGSICVGLC